MGFTFSPNYPQSNGMSEMAVKTSKKILRKCSDPHIGLLEYRNTPLTGMQYSPAQPLMSRHTRTKLPMTSNLYKPSIPHHDVVRHEFEHAKAKQKHFFDRTAKPQPGLQQSELARMFKNGVWEKAQVKAQPITQDHTSYRQRVDANIAATDQLS